MKNPITLWLVLCALFISQHANAYYLEHAIAGTVTIQVTGACAIPKTSVKAYIADISDDEHNPLGWGIVTASGHLIAIREAQTDVLDKENFASKTKKSTDYVDLAGDTLKTFLIANGIRCDIARLQSGITSSVTYSTIGTGGRAVLQSRITGYEVQRCQDSGDVQTCKARRINGKIDFTGKW